MTAADTQLERVFRVEVPRVRARLVGEFGDFDLAEDLLQDALVKALERWPREGVPQSPAAWLVTVARRQGIDAARHHQVRARVRDAVRELYASDAQDEAGFDDDMLRLIFTCCHPSLALEAQAALTLRTVVDLTLEQVARAFLVAPRAMEQRLVRAKRKIRQAGIPYEIPDEKQLEGRLRGVLTVVYLIFNEGYAATDGDDLIRHGLCREAIRLMRVVNRLQRGHAEALALLALMLLQDSRARARVDDRGRLVLLEDQDRGLWDRSKILEGTALLEKALALRQKPGAFQIQAAIAALHANAAPSDTDWREIAALYERLLLFQNTPVVRLNRAVAVFMSGARQRALRLMEEIETDRHMRDYCLFHSAHGGLLARAGDYSAALTCYLRAQALVSNKAERDFIEARIVEMRRNGSITEPRSGS
ncbi:MAG: sigma-70 family RNA polymerase sigma factor [Gammaproteobacteria bacterium]|nr:sigma-70 family RNA polymerase sigma factor [Gammaproteobacteria bacterium]